MTDPDTRKLFVAGLPESVTELELRRMFEAAGASVEDVAVPRDRQTGRARGFGFITLATEEQAEQVREALDGSFQDGRPISVRPFRGNRTPGAPMPSRPPHSGPREPLPGGGGGGGGGSADDRENTLFLANLPSDCREDELTEIFRDAGVGPILKLHMPVDPDGRRRGFGFVSLRDSAAAREAVPKLREKALRGRPLTVDVARPRAERPSGGSGERPAVGGGGAWRSRPPPPRGGEGGMSSGPPMRSFGGDSGGPPPVERQTWDERRDPNKRKKEPAAKKKKVRATDRTHARRENEGFRAPRARGLMDDWDDE